MANQIRAPYEIPPLSTKRSLYRAPDIFPNLLLGILSASPMPFNAQFDWPNPQRRTTAPQIVEYPNLALGFGPANFAAAIQFRPPLEQPIRPKRPPQIFDYPNVLAFLSLPGPRTIPFPSYDWPNPPRQRDTLEPMSWRTMSYYNPVPFAPIDWPNPLLRKGAPQILEEPNNFLIGNLSLITVTFAPFDWPNPPRKPTAPQIFEYPSLVLNLKLAPNFPPVDWPNPLRRKAAPQIVEQPNLLLSGLLKPLAPLPRRAFDWPNPPRYSPVRYQLEQFNNLFLINAVPTPPVPPVTPGEGVTRPGGRVILLPKKVGEKIPYPIDFISALGAGETIASAFVTSAVYSGVDLNPGAVVSGAASISGTIVTQVTVGGVDGTIYELVYTANTNLGNIIEISGLLSVTESI